MRYIQWIFALVLVTGLCVISLSAGERYLNLDKTLRVDFILTGSHQYQKAFLSEVSQHNGWSGSAQQLISPFEFGEYRSLLIHPESGDTVYSRGFSTLFEEWRTIDEAREKERAFQQTVLMPLPETELILAIDGRERDGSFSELLNEMIDPSSLGISVNRPAPHPFRVIHGENSSEQKVELLFLAEGYTMYQQDKFFRDVEKLTRQVLRVEPFRSYKDKITVSALAIPSVESGTQDPRADVWPNTALKSSFNTFGIDRYLESEATWRIHDYAALLPHDHLVVLVNSSKYGGGGIYNHFSVVTSDNQQSGTVLIHELGHGFAGLGDEYYGSEVSYNEYINLDIEPWQPNLTTLVDFDRKWKDMVAPETPVPTPVNGPYQKLTGVFEGGGYVNKGVYRPAVKCRMRSNSAREFCEVCRLVIQQKIDFYTK